MTKLSSKKIKIGFINTNRDPYPLPPASINGGMWITGKLVEAFAPKENFEVYFFTTEDSKVPETVHKITLGLESLYKQYGTKVFLPEYKTRHVFYQQLLLAEAIKHTDLDLLHIHNYFPHAANFLEYFKIPIVYTLHNPIVDYHKIFFTHRSLPRSYFITLTEYQDIKAKKAKIPVVAKIVNGVDTQIFNFSPEGGDSIFFPSRVASEKGILEAITIADNTRQILSLSSINIDNPTNLEQQVLSITKSKPSIKILHNKNQADMVNSYRKSKLSLFPIQWDEPFGLVMIESMAIGTPVLALARGSVPEIIKDGETGFIVNPSDDDIRGNWIIKKTGVEGLCEAVNRIYSMSPDEYKQMRLNCRKLVEKYFTVEKMVDSYEEVYQQILQLSAIKS